MVCNGELYLCLMSDCSSCGHQHAYTPAAGCIDQGGSENPFLPTTHISSEVTVCDEWAYTERMYSGNGCKSDWISTVTMNANVCTPFQLWGMQLYGKWVPN